MLSIHPCSMPATHADRRHGSSGEMTLLAVRDFMMVRCIVLLLTSSWYCQQFTAEQLLPGQRFGPLDFVLGLIDTNRGGCIQYMGLLEFWTWLKCAISVTAVDLVIYQQQQQLEMLVAEQPLQRQAVLTVHSHSNHSCRATLLQWRTRCWASYLGPSASVILTLHLPVSLSISAILSNALQTLARCKIKHVNPSA